MSARICVVSSRTTAARDTALEAFSKRLYRIGGKISGDDVATINSLTSNDTLKMKYAEVCAPCVAYVKGATDFQKIVEESIPNRAFVCSACMNIEACKRAQAAYQDYMRVSSCSKSEAGGGLRRPPGLSVVRITTAPKWRAVNQSLPLQVRKANVRRISAVAPLLALVVRRECRAWRTGVRHRAYPLWTP